MYDPRKEKKFLLRVFGGDREVYKDFLKFYDEAVAEGSIIPQEIAWIRFREVYQETETGFTHV